MNLEPNPDEILARIKLNTARSQSGCLKIFFGMAPGVGKTYAMLQAAHAAKKKGIDVVVGVVETHGRAETLAMVEGLPQLPSKVMDYRGVTLGEFDLDAALVRKPQLILIDELAHTNVEGCTHEKRYQDVEDLLAQGIDVYTTLNVQHLESRADAVSSITGIVVRETVPDSIFARADDIQLVDLPPELLLSRLNEGKVYVADRAQSAMKNFFKEENLVALRELSLRMMTERVDNELLNMRQELRMTQSIWKKGAKLMVAVGPSPFSTNLIRWTRRMAYSMNAPWIALSVEKGDELSAEVRSRLDDNLELARRLGAEVMVISGNDVVEALLRVAYLNNVTQIVVGKSNQSPLFGLFHKRSLVDRLIYESGEIDVYVVPSDKLLTTNPHQESLWRTMKNTRAKEWLVMLLTLVGVTSLGLLLAPVLSYYVPSFLYLMSIVGLAFYVRSFLVILAAFLSAALWDFLFIIPLYTFYIQETQDVLMCVTFMGIAVSIGHIMSRLRKQEKMERERLDRTSVLLRFMNEIYASTDVNQMLNVSEELLFSALSYPVAVFVPQSSVDRELKVHSTKGGYVVNDKELGVAQWSYENKKCAGRFTQTLPGVGGFYVPLVVGDRCFGVIGIMSHGEYRLSVADRNLLETMASQMAMVFDRFEMEDVRAKVLAVAESENLNRALLDNVSHEFRTPLSIIEGVSEQMARLKDVSLNPEAKSEELSGELTEATQRLKQLIQNLLDMSRLRSGALTMQWDWCDWGDVLECALKVTQKMRQGYAIDIDLPDDFPLFYGNFSLMEQVLVNIIMNVCRHTPIGTMMQVRGGILFSEKLVWIDVLDNGPGIDDEMKDQLFDRFVSGGVGGIGLGLSIVKGFMEAQKGGVSLMASPQGTCIRLTMPYVESAGIDE